MGFGFPAAIGAQLAKPDAQVIADCWGCRVPNDTSRIVSITRNRIPVKIIILNNRALGMVRQWQETFYEKRYSQSLIPDSTRFRETGRSL